MSKYRCKKCNELHEVVTLFEFPQPDIISKITSGKLNQELYSIGKDFFMVDKSRAIVQSELSVNILNFEDELDMLVWVIIEREEYLKKIKNLKEIDEVRLQGTLYHGIPFYEDTTQLPVVIEVDLNGSITDKPKVVRILKENQFQTDFENGIDLPEFEAMLTKLYHFEN